MSGVDPQLSRPPSGSDSWRRGPFAHSHSRESKRAIPFLRSVMRVEAAGPGGGGALQRAGRDGTVLKAGTPTGVAARRWLREAAPVRPDHLGEVAGDFTRSGGLNFSRTRKPLLITVTPNYGHTVSPEARSCQKLPITLSSRWERAQKLPSLSVT
uniref:Uncharacterized protein n=1 Tax=Molossus molossus TaxID=27622 RepID=A0A7J8E2U4_MOLMO|nr:hypothetical protein HJG59_009012 [Molossus molossus]